MRAVYGFNLIELLIVIGIVSLLSIMAIPIYRHHLVNVRRLEAESVLTQLSVAMEEYQLKHGTYVGATVALLGFEDEVADHRYHVAMAEVTDVFYELHAMPLGDQAEEDDACKVVSLNSAGEKNCW